eukprot:scaffold1311_cov256-Pinguiococcus_pyrenoidosus.AAC.15
MARQHGAHLLGCAPGAKECWPRTDRPLANTAEGNVVPAGMGAMPWRGRRGGSWTHGARERARAVGGVADPKPAALRGGRIDAGMSSSRRLASLRLRTHMC